MPNPEQERERIAGVYSGMSDGELEKVAATGYDLSEVARQALEAEISSRNLDLKIAALLAKATLDSAGIKALLVDDNMVRIDWFWSNLLGGIKLKVRPEDEQEANEILNQPIPEKLDIEGVGEYEQPRCPRCQSLDVNYRELNKAVSFGSAYLGIPIPVHTKAWSCHACGNRWDEDRGNAAHAGDIPL